MGVPALFRWLSRKYPKIIESVVECKDDSPGDCSGPNPNGFEVDNLFLDMNGIIHPCCHPTDKPAPSSETEMMAEVFKYLDRLMAMVRPRRLLYLAVDGVAPRAKMNQQRSRRFRAAKEAKEKASLQKEEPDDDDATTATPNTAVFDTNVITPGTPFMQLVTDSIKYYIYNRMNGDNPLFGKLRVVFSDWTVPGEGEHKIVDFIRRQRLDPEFDANQENVIYGLDADLIMLAMATHEARFRVLREDVFWEEEQRRGGQCRNCLQTGHLAGDCPNPPTGDDPHMEKPFIFLNVSVLREYLEVEMRPNGRDFPFDPERAIDDWIFLCFFVGNDFLPHLPSLELRDGAIDTLIDIYRNNGDIFAGPLTKDGRINLERVRVILERLAGQEEDILRRRKEREDRREDAAKRRKTTSCSSPTDSPAMLGRQSSRTAPAVDPKNTQRKLELEKKMYTENAEIRPVDAGPADSLSAIELKRAINQTFAKRPAPNATPEDDSSSTPTTPDAAIDEVRLHEPGARSRYYIAKFGKDPRDNPDFVRDVCRAYLEGVAWVMAYYYQGCPSWKWYYPHHYAPFAADFVEFLAEDHAIWRDEMRFELGMPFRPFDQLMSVFPAASAEHIPEPFRRLMVDAQSEILDFYPDDFCIDLNGKKQTWQGVALLPFIDEDRLLGALERVYPELRDEHLKLNRRGHDLLFVGDQSTAFGFLCDLDTDQSAIWPLDVLLTRGLSGCVRYWDEGCEIGGTVPSPIASAHPIAGNQVVAALFYPPGVSGQESTLKLHFAARMLPKARRPPPVLSAEERAAVRSGQQHTPRQHHHSMNRDWAERQERQAAHSNSSHFRPPNPSYHEQRQQSRQYSHHSQHRQHHDSYHQ